MPEDKPTGVGDDGLCRRHPGSIILLMHLLFSTSAVTVGFRLSAFVGSDCCGHLTAHMILNSGGPSSLLASTPALFPP